MRKIPSMDEMIAGVKRKQKDNEIIVFAFGVGRLIPMKLMRKATKAAMEEAIEFIKAQEGFVGVHPIDLWHNLLIFETLNNAKGARNSLKFKGVSVGEIVPVLIPKYMKGETNL